MKIDGLRKRLDALRPGPEAGDTCPRWEDARLAFVVALDGNRNAARVLVNALKNDRQTRSCPELIDFALISLEPFPEVRESVVAALQDICTCRA
jgi:hypothetical protein